MIPTVVVNLDRDKERLAHMERECARLGLSFTRFPAVLGAALPETLKPYFEALGISPLGPGEIGCYASHLAICQELLAGRLPAPLLVLEDDVGLSDDIAALCDAAIAAAPAGWDFIRLSNPPKRAYARVADLPGGRALIRYTVVPTSTGAHLISASGARKFLKQDVRRLPVDQDLRRVWRWDLDMYGVAPAPIAADVLQSSSIDAQASVARGDAKRRARLRRERGGDNVERVRWNIRRFGWARWLALEWTDLRARLAPKRDRAALLARAAR